MAFRLDRRLSYQNLIEWQYAQYGILDKCLECGNFKECDSPQYNARGLFNFECANFKEKRGK